MLEVFAALSLAFKRRM